MTFMERLTASWQKFRKPGYYEEFDYDFPEGAALWLRDR